MRVGDVLYFSPRYRFADLDLNDTSKIVDALRDRVTGFYLDPATRLLSTSDAFAAGLLCCAAIDFIALCAEVPPEAWLAKNIGAFGNDEQLAGRFWRWFRDGLVHEGRIKSFGQFSLDFSELLTVVEPAMIVNPQRLLRSTQAAFASQIERLDETESARLLKRLRRYFAAEVAFAARVAT